MSVMAIVFDVLASGYWRRPGSNASLPIFADNAIWLGQSDIACELRRPECHVGLRGAGGFAPLVTMPEATAHEDDCVPLGQHNVRMSGQLGGMETVAESQ